MEKIIKENFILAFQIDNDELLDGLIEYHKNNEEYKYRSDATHGKEVKDSTDVNIQIVSNNKFIKDYTNYLVSGLREYSKRYKHFNPELCISEGFNIQHYSPGQGYKQWHNERGEHQAHQRALVFMTYLNDVPDGGGTEFAYYPEVKLKAKKGLSIIWPTDFTHTHRGIVSQHEKWIATGWFNHQGVKETKATIKEKIQADFDSGRLKEKK
jgi:prolyl 4-hydroxylase